MSHDIHALGYNIILYLPSFLDRGRLFVVCTLTTLISMDSFLSDLFAKLGFRSLHLSVVELGINYKVSSFQLQQNLITSQVICNKLPRPSSLVCANFM